jgi:hypothetical protein
MLFLAVYFEKQKKKSKFLRCRRKSGAFAEFPASAGAIFPLHIAIKRPTAKGKNTP